MEGLKVCFLLYESTILTTPTVIYFNFLLPIHASEASTDISSQVIIGYDCGIGVRLFIELKEVYGV